MAKPVIKKRCLGDVLLNFFMVCVNANLTKQRAKVLAIEL